MPPGLCISGYVSTRAAYLYAGGYQPVKHSLVAPNPETGSIATGASPWLLQFSKPNTSSDYGKTLNTC